MDGVVVLLKAPGMTSSNAVYDVRRIFGQKRAGHAARRGDLLRAEIGRAPCRERV